MTQNNETITQTDAAADFAADMAAVAAHQQSQHDSAVANDDVPSCECGTVVGEHNLGVVCHQCGTKCHYVDTSRNPVVDVPPVSTTPTADYVSFEQYLDLMRRMHAYETMPPKDALQFDNACVYRWRDIKSLRLAFSQNESGVTNPLSRFTSELRRVNDLLDSAYLELSHLRRLIGLEMTHFKSMADKAKAKRQTTLGMQYTALVNRLANATVMRGTVRQSDDVRELNEALRNAHAYIQQLSTGIATEAQECYRHVETKRTAGDVASAERHQHRGDRLMALIANSAMV